MAQHTNGPFRVDVTKEVRWADNFGLIILAPDGKTPVGYACDFNRTDRDDEKRANARLFAAAPDLLWALEAIAGREPSQHDPGPADRQHMTTIDCYDCEEMINLARAAIAKARGG